MSALEDFFGWSGTVLTLSFFISPIIPFINVFRGKLDYEDTPAIIIVASYCNCLVWFVYGQLINSLQIRMCNIIGCGASLFLILIYLIYEIRKYTIDAILNALILFTGSWSAYRALTIILNNPNTIGKICVCTTLIVFISPVQLIYRVISEKNYRLIPIVTAIFSILSGAAWVTYGLLRKDFYVAGPNTMAIVIGILQVIVWNVWKRKYPTIEQIREIATIGIESTGDEGDFKKETTTRSDEEKEDNIKVKPVKIVTKKDDVKESG